MEALGKIKFPLQEVLSVAKELVALLKPHCSRIGICGSVRRSRPLCSDAEILFIPRLREEPDGLFEKKLVSEAHEALEKLLAAGVIEKRKNVNGHETWGEQNRLARHVASGIPVDFFATDEARWAVALVIRTGGKRTNLALTMGANKRGLTLHAYGNGFTKLATGEKIVCNSEEDVFRHAGIAYVAPQYRK